MTDQTIPAQDPYWALADELQTLSDQIRTLAYQALRPPNYAMMHINAGVLTHDAALNVPLVDTIAATLGLPVANHQPHGCGWEHGAAGERGLLEIRLHCAIPDPCPPGGAS